MPLQQLVNHFNDRFEKEHHANFRPFSLDNGLVSGIFGPIRISSGFLPVRQASDNSIAGHIAQLRVAPYTLIQQDGQAVELANLVTDTVKQPADFQSIINLDRLCRTVHMLNYLPYSHIGGTLFLDVDPRHILSVKQDHGAYFEEIIGKCGLATKNIAISLEINDYYALEHGQLLAGLSNYRNRGYQLALNIGNHYTANGLIDFIAKLAPNYLRVNVPVGNINGPDAETIWPSALATLKGLQELNGGQYLVQAVDKEEQAFVASGIGFGLVQGDYYDRLTVDHLRCL